jgi:cytochrome c oxidase assembly protein subunit 15
VQVANPVLLQHRARLPDGPHRPTGTPQVLRLSTALVALAGIVLVTGTLVTGSGPHGGDEAADRLPFAVRTVVPFHGAAVWALLLLSMLLLHRAERGDVEPAATSRGRLLIGAICAQGGIGYLQYFTGVPEGLVGLHVLGSVLVWAAVLHWHLALHEGVPDLEPSGAAPSLAVASG